MRRSCILLLSAVALVCHSQGACPNFWSRFHDSCYYFFQDTEGWFEANKICEHYGGYLVTIESAAENSFLTTLIKTTQVHPQDVWIGANDIMREGVFMWWKTSKQVSDGYSNWHTGTPDNVGGDENCAEFKKSLGYRWNDDVCSDKEQYICEKSPDFELVG